MSRVGSLVCPIIVGRDDLLALADRWLPEVAAGRGRALFIAGPAGIGKTRLARAIYRKAEAASFRVEGGSVAPHDRHVPLASILDFARGVTKEPTWGSVGADVLAIEGRAGGDALARRRTLVLEIADRIVGCLDRPTVLSFEDLQWTDELSLEVIGELARRAAELPLLLLATYRLDELPVGSSHREWRSRLLSQRFAEEARLRPLTLEETAVATTLILGRDLPAPRDVVAAVHERTNGIPLHVEELLGALDEADRLDGRTIRQAHVPDTIEDAVLARVARLSPEARTVAGAGAVIGRCFVPDVVADMLGRPLAELEPAFAELVETAILHPFQFVDEGYFDFRHQMLRDAIYAHLPPGQLRRMHGQVAELGSVLIGASEVHASAHYERAGRRAEAFRAARAGAEAASRVSARSEAFELYRRAVDNLPDDLPLVEQAELYEAYSDAAAAVDDSDQCEAAARAARERYASAGLPDRAAAMLLSIATIARREAHPVAERFAQLDEAAAELDGLPPSSFVDELRAMLHLLRAASQADALDLAAARASVQAARGVAPTEDLALDCDVMLAEIDVLAGATESGLERSMAGARLARDRGFEATGVTAYRNTALLAARVIDYPTAERALAEGLAYAEAVEQSHCRHSMRTTVALIDWAHGRWDDALAGSQQEVADGGCTRATLGSLDVIGYVALGRGAVDDARRALDASLAGGRRSGEAGRTLPALWGLAELALVEGDPARAAALCSEALELAAVAGERALLVPFVPTGIRAFVARNRPDEAEHWLSRVGGALATWEDLARPALDHGTGLLRLAIGPISAARDALEAAIRGWDVRGRTWEATWARLDLAQALLRAARFAEAVALLAEAREVATRLASPPLLGRIDELQRAARGRGTVDEPWRPLTAREFEVARLVAEGLTNAEIAGALSIAPKTASAHVEHILAKLGVSRRAEIGAWAATVSRAATTSDRAGSEQRART